MVRPPLEVADVLRAHAADYFTACDDAVSSAKRRVVRDLVACRTLALGGHVDACDSCDYERHSYNSCRNRHCPKCQGQANAEWLEAREQDLLPVEYFHVVFTLPEQIAEIAQQNKKVLYDILLRASAQTLLQIAADPKHLGARIGFVSVLHTWGQTLIHHPHVHCVVPGGGLALDDSGRFVASPRGFFLSHTVLSLVFRGKFLEMTRRAFARGELCFQGGLAHLEDPDCFEHVLQQTYACKWVVHVKPPFGGPRQVLKYLARYTHRVAISNTRLLSLRDGRVTFRYKDYAHGDKQRTMTLEATEFVRRFLLHVLPKGFMRIRHYGLLANTCRAEQLERCREALCCAAEPVVDSDVSPSIEDDERRCPKCKVGHLHRHVLDPVYVPRLEPAGIDSS